MICRKAAIIFVLLLSQVLAITINPPTQDITNPSQDVSLFVYTIINDDPQPRSLTFRLEPLSEYLSSSVKLSKDHLSLLPGESENIQLSVNPAGLGPQTHIANFGVYQDNDLLSNFEFSMTLPGTVREQYDVTINAVDTNTQSAVPITIVLSNGGNIVGYAHISLTVEQGGKVVGTISYPDAVQVLPGKTKELDLVYTEQLSPGFYTAILNASFGEITAGNQDQFTVRLESSKEYINEGSDLELSFASLGNPPAVVYSLIDTNAKELAAGTFLPTNGIIIPTSALPAGEYTLLLKLQQGDQRITLIIRPHRDYGLFWVIIAVFAIVGYGVFSYRKEALLRWRIYKLQTALNQRQEEVIKLINRSHRLVDEYHARARQTSRSPRESTQRP